MLEFFSPRVASLRRRRDIPGLVEALGSARARDRRAAANALIRIPDRRALDALRAAIRDSDPLVRANASLALGEFSGTHPELISIADPLVEALGDDLASVRAMAASALGRMKDSRAVEPLIGLLDDESPVVRKTAAAVLRGFDDAQAVEALARRATV